MTVTISSQRYLDEEIIEIKRESQDYTVIVTPDFEVAGVTMRAIVDGHHSLAAAKADGVEPVIETATIQSDDRIALLNTNIDDYLSLCYVDSDWYDVETGLTVF